MRTSYDYEKSFLPKFPRTQHLPLEPNAQRDDLIADPSVISYILDEENLVVEEKVDGANLGMTILDGQVVLRNRNHVLNRGYTGAKDSAATQQFSSTWTWFYQRFDQFQALEKALGFMPGVYGEWLYAQHTVPYHRLPEPFLIFDLYDPDVDAFLSPEVTYPILDDLGIKRVPCLHKGKISAEKLLTLRNNTSEYSDSLREGIYLKRFDPHYILERYKMVRSDFISGEHWSKTKITRNGVVNR